MKFYNKTLKIENANEFVVLLDNQETDQSFLTITIELINPVDNEIKIYFKRKNEDGEFISELEIKSGTTILDHLIVIPPNTQYLIQSSVTNTIVSCSYAQ